jgi:hypothetical protein
MAEDGCAILTSAGHDEARRRVPAVRVAVYRGPRSCRFRGAVAMTRERLVRLYADGFLRECVSRQPGRLRVALKMPVLGLMSAERIAITAILRQPLAEAGGSAENYDNESGHTNPAQLASPLSPARTGLSSHPPRMHGFPV